MYAWVGYVIIEFGEAPQKFRLNMRVSNFSGPRSLMSWIWTNHPNKVGQHIFLFLGICWHLRHFDFDFLLCSRFMVGTEQGEPKIQLQFMRNNLIFFLRKHKMNIFCTKWWGTFSFVLFSRNAQAMCLLATERQNLPPKELLDATGLTIRPSYDFSYATSLWMMHVMSC